MNTLICSEELDPLDAMHSPNTRNETLSEIMSNYDWQKLPIMTHAVSELQSPVSRQLIAFAPVRLYPSSHVTGAIAPYVVPFDKSAAPLRIVAISQSAKK